MYRRAFLYPVNLPRPCYREIELSEMLAERDARDRLRRNWQQEKQPYLSLVLNLPGKIKRMPLSDFFFCGAERALLQSLSEAGVYVSRYERREAAAGLSSHFILEGISARNAKKLAMRIEDHVPAGRLLDADVFDSEGIKLSGDASRGVRPCLICGGNVFVCSRSRAHSADSVLGKATELMREHLLALYADELRHKALRAMLREALASPKPGLVDRENNGSHQDMDLYLFTDSSTELSDLLRRIADLSLTLVATDNTWEKRTVCALRECGAEAERALLRATGGVNTQIGLFFAFAILIPAALQVFAKSLARPINVEKHIEIPSARAIGREAALLAQIVCQSYLKENDGKAEGARASALSGYRLLIEEAAPLLRELREEGWSRDGVSLRILLYLMARTSDSNLLRRGGAESLQWVQNRSRALEYAFDGAGTEREEEFIDEMRSFDREMIKRNLSPGGAADLLALSWFFAEVDRESTL